MKILRMKTNIIDIKLELSKWVGTREPTWLTMGSGWVEIFLQISIQVDF